jgi:hypothetical protein
MEVVDETSSRTYAALCANPTTITVLGMKGSHAVALCWNLHWLSCVSLIEKGISSPRDEHLRRRTKLDFCLEIAKGILL